MPANHYDDYYRCMHDVTYSVHECQAYGLYMDTQCMSKCTGTHCIHCSTVYLCVNTVYMYIITMLKQTSWKDSECEDPSEEGLYKNEGKSTVYVVYIHYMYMCSPFT